MSRVMQELYVTERLNSRYVHLPTPEALVLCHLTLGDSSLSRSPLLVPSSFSFDPCTPRPHSAAQNSAQFPVTHR